MVHGLVVSFAGNARAARPALHTAVQSQRSRNGFLQNGICSIARVPEIEDHYISLQVQHGEPCVLWIGTRTLHATTRWCQMESMAKSDFRGETAMTHVQAIPYQPRPVRRTYKTRSHTTREVAAWYQVSVEHVRDWVRRHARWDGRFFRAVFRQMIALRRPGKPWRFHMIAGAVNQRSRPPAAEGVRRQTHRRPPSRATRADGAKGSDHQVTANEEAIRSRTFEKADERSTRVGPR